MEAISHAGTAIGILASDGIVLAAEKKLNSKLLEPTKSSEKMYMIDQHVAVAVAGITADANILINQARLHAQRYRFAFQEPQPVEQLVQTLCDEKQAYTQYGGLRPFGVSLLYAGWDKTCALRRASLCAAHRSARARPRVPYTVPSIAIGRVCPEPCDPVAMHRCSPPPPPPFLPHTRDLALTLWAVTASNCISRIHQATTMAGRPRALAPITSRPCRS